MSWCLILVVGLFGPLVHVQDETATAPKTEALAIAAIAGDHPISQARVDRHLKKTLGQLAVPDQFTTLAKREALEHLIRRHAVLTAIKGMGAAPAEAEVLMEIDKLNDRLKEVNQTFDDYLKKSGLTRAELEYEFEWKIVWRRHLSKSLSEERLLKHYSDHQRQFDGTQVKVAHLLIQNPERDTQSNLELANQIKDDITRGKIGWDEAVAKYSDAKTSSDNGGEAGWISYSGPMPPEFCRAAINLQSEQISAPVQTAFGIHLIKCLEVKAGKIGPRDAMDDMRRDATRSLFDLLANKHRPSMDVKYHVDWPVAKR